jgi:hypothetical protein
MVLLGEPPAHSSGRFSSPSVLKERPPGFRSGLLLALALVAASCATPPKVGTVHDREDPREVLRAFVRASLKGEFEQAYGLLSTPWRRRYTPATFKRDFELEPSALVRLQRALRAAESLPREEAQGVVFPLPNGWAVRLVHETDGYKLAALE